MLKKGSKVARVISIMGSKTIVFNYRVTYVNKDRIATIRHKDESESSSCSYSAKTGEEVGGMASSYLVSHKKGIQLVKEGRVKLDEGEKLP